MEQREYWDAIRSGVANCLEEAENEDDARDNLDRHFADHEFVIYTRKSLYVLLHSPNDDALFDQVGDDALVGVTSASDVYLRLAGAAILQDAQDELERQLEHHVFEEEFEEEEEEEEGA